MRDPADLQPEEVDQLLDQYLQEFSASTRTAYAGDIRKLSAWTEAAGHPNVLCLSSEDVTQYLATLLSEDRSVSYVRRLVQRVPSLYKFAYRRGISVDRSVEDVSVPTIPRKTGAGRRLSDADVSRLVHFADQKPRWSAVIRLLALYGVAPGEIGRIRVGDLEADVPAHLSVGDGDSRRRFPLDPRTAESLTTLRHGRRTGSLVENQAGRPITTFNVGQLVKAVAKRADLAVSVNASQLRATMIALAIDREIPIYDIARSVGLLRLEKIEQYLPPDMESRTNVGIVVADLLAPDPAEAILSFVRSSLAKKDFPAAGLCALVGLLAEGQIRAAVQSAGAKVRGQESLTTMTAALIEEEPQFAPARSYVAQLSGIRNLAAHGHLHEVTYDDVDASLELFAAIDRVLQNR